MFAQGSRAGGAWLARIVPPRVAMPLPYAGVAQHLRDDSCRLTLMARFKVDHSFAIRSSRLLILAGEIADGALRPGMTVDLAVDGGVREFEVAGIDLIRYSVRRPEAEVGLTLRCSDNVELSQLQALRLEGVVLDFAWRPGRGRSEI